MIMIDHVVTPNDTLFSLCEKYNVTKDMIINSNVMRYPNLAIYPFMIFQNWTLRIPLVINGGNTEYNLK